MLKIQTKILRKDKTFLDADTKQVIETFRSISEAKRESRKIQQLNGGMGRGYLQTIDTRAQRLKQAGWVKMAHRSKKGPTQISAEHLEYLSQIAKQRQMLRKIGQLMVKNKVRVVE